MRKIAHFLFRCASQLTSVKCDRAGFWRFLSLSFPLPSTCLRAVEKRWGEKTLPVVVKNHGQRNLSEWAMRIYCNGQRNLKRRATKFFGTGNEIYRNGQRNLPERALKFKASGDEIYTNPIIYRRWAGISVLLFIHAYLYIRIGINNKTNI